ncbi:MAG: preprotein translocase subunit SecG [Verrucomicrobiota bacterium]|nr:preprotein translocase subunit SecG [Verrucomicrobiota bacterium]
MDLSINILSGLFICVSLLMLLVILMQRPKSEGLGAAFGGGVTENIFGAQTTNVLTKITGWLAAIFFILTFVLSILYAHKGNSKSNLTQRVKDTTPQSTAIVSPTPVPGPSSAVGPPGTVTNPTPASTGPGPSVKPSDLAVGAVPPASGSQPVATPVASPVSTPAASMAPSAAPSVSAKPKP